MTKPSSKFHNPDFVRDRFKEEILNPMMPQAWTNRQKQPWNPTWMDYCDPYHCNDYHKLACGLNRKNMRFKWFQSGCHIILNNMCSKYRGTLQYDMVDPKFCAIYVLHLRMGCPVKCDKDVLKPVCAISMFDNHLVLFQNKCFLDAANCRSESLDEYEESDMRICAHYY